MNANNFRNQVASNTIIEDRLYKKTILPLHRERVIKNPNDPVEMRPNYSEKAHEKNARDSDT